VSLLNRSTRVWDGYAAFSFAVSLCFVSGAFSIAGWFGPNFTITIHPLQVVVDTQSVLFTAATFLPAFYCFTKFPECRLSLRKLRASWKIYLIAIATGMVLPFTGYFGSHRPEFPWGSEAAMSFGRLFARNLFLVPLWEEIVWRGCFLNKVRLFTSPSSGILLTSIGFTVLHGPKIAVFYSSGLPLEVLLVLPFIYFCLGVILGSVFELGRGSLWPCVLLHASFNAAAGVFAGSYNRSSELGSYVSELVVMVILARFFLRAAIRQGSLPAYVADCGQQ